MSWQAETAKWLGLFLVGKLLPAIYKRARVFFIKKSDDFVAFQMLNEYQTLLWFNRKPERFYKYAFESIMGAMKMLAWAGGWAAMGFIFHQIAPTARAKDGVAQWTIVVVVLIFSFMMTRCRMVELTARRLNQFDSYRATVPGDIVKQAEGDPRLK